MTSRSRSAFTIIELLVVVAIIGALMALIFPALGKSRDHGQVLKSQSNLRQLQLANFTYGAENNDRQLTYIYDYLARYGTRWTDAVLGYGREVPTKKFAYVGTMGELPYGGVLTPWFDPPDGVNQWGEGHWVPLQFDDHDGHQGYGSFRMTSYRPINAYFDNRFYHPIFYAPKDSLAMNLAEPRFEKGYDFEPGDVTVGQGQQLRIWFPSYCYSAAAMYNPLVLAKNPTTGKYFTDPWTMPTSLKSPTFSQARYPGQKTHMLEHHWLQNRRKEVNPNLPMVPDLHFCPNHYEQSAPYFFNHSRESTPVTAFFDGHVGFVGQMQAIEADARAATQSGGGGLWTRDTPMGVDGYFGAIGFDETRTSYHMLTIDGILGRDIVDTGP